MPVMTTLVIKHHATEAAQTIIDRLIRVTTDKREAVEGIVRQLVGLQGGNFEGRVSVKVEDVSAGDRASSTAKCVSVVATDTLKIGDVTLTVSASPSGESQVAVGASDTLQAVIFVTAINAHTQLLGLVTATSAGDTVTITSAYPGRIGEMITLVVTGGTITLSAAALAGITATNAAIFRDHEMGVA